MRDAVCCVARVNGIFFKIQRHVCDIGYKSIIFTLYYLTEGRHAFKILYPVFLCQTIPRLGLESYAYYSHSYY